MTWLPPELKQALHSGVVAIFLAWLGRMMWHVSEVQKQRRRFFSLHLVWELFFAVAIGFVADGVAAYFGLDGKPALAAIVVIAYLGPRGVEVVIMKAIDKYGSGSMRG